MPKNQSKKNENKVLKNKRINTGEKGGKIIKSMIPPNIPLLFIFIILLQISQ